MSLTFLKESEAAYPDRLVSGHYPLKPLMPQRKYNVRASFTPGSNAPSSQRSQPSQISNSKSSFVAAYEQPRPVMHPAYRSPPALAHPRPTIYTSPDTSGIARHATEAQTQCGCPSRRINVLNLPSSQYKLFLEVLASVGDVEQKPERDAENKLSLQFYDTRAVLKLADTLPSIAPLAGVSLQKVPLESDVCVLVDVPWGQSVTRDALLVPLEKYGSVATLNFGKPLIGGPQQVVCVYNDVRDATKLLNKPISVNGVQLPVRLMSIPHAHACPSLSQASLSNRSQAQTPYSGIGVGSLDSPPVPPAFASSTSSMSPLASPYSTALSDMATSYFTPIDNPWAANNKAPMVSVDLSSGQSDQHGLNNLTPQLVGIGGHPRRTAARSRDFDAAPEHTIARGTSGMSLMEPANNERFSGSYGPIGSTTASTGGTATGGTATGSTVFDSILNKSPFGPLSTTAAHGILTPGGSSMRLPESLNHLEGTGGTEMMEPLEPVSSRQTKPQDVEKCMNILKRFAGAEAKTDTKEPKHSDRERGNDIDLNAIESGDETRTTVMLRNIPNKLDFKDLKRFLDATNRCTYDFLYLRFDFMNRCNVGYAFISFTKPKHVATFVKARAGMKWSQYNYNSEKVIEIKFARIQGRDSLIQKFRNSPVMSQDPAFKPRLYYTKGKLSGKEEPFPDPTSTTGKPSAS